MSDTPIAESVLSLIAGRDRAAAIMGDLAELSATRGRLWFWIAYFRTILTLAWRTPIAFAVGIASLTALDRLWSFFFRHVPFRWWVNSHHPYVQQAIFYLALQLWFLIPFAIVRYGLKDRLVRAGLPLLLMMTGAVLRVPRLSPFLVGAAVAAIAVFLARTSSRRPAIALVTTSVIGVFALLNLQFLAHMACWIDEHKPLNASSHYRFFDTGFAFPHTLFWVVVWTVTLLNMLVTAFACSRLRHRLMELRQVETISA
jgi:hypothetical protein